MLSLSLRMPDKVEHMPPCSMDVWAYTLLLWNSNAHKYQQPTCSSDCSSLQFDSMQDEGAHAAYEVTDNEIIQWSYCHSSTGALLHM